MTGPPLYTAETCDASDPAPGVRLIRGGTVMNRLSPCEALHLAGDLIAAAIKALADSTGCTP